MSAKSNKLFSGTALAVAAVLLVTLVMLSNELFRGVRFDLTENKLYTMSQGTRNIIDKIDEPINLYFFFSDEVSKDVPQLRNYAKRVREMLQEFAQRGGDRINLQVLDPVPFSEEEDEAAQFGLQAVPLGAIGETIYFGLAGTNTVDDVQTIPFFEPDKETFLEYDLSKLVDSLANPKRPVIGLLSGLPMRGDFDPATRRQVPSWFLADQIDQLFDLRDLSAPVAAIDADIDVLMLVHPKELDEDTVYAIDQFVLRGGKALIFVDPYAETDQPPQDPNNPMAAMFASRSSGLPALFQAWGIEYDPGKIVGDDRYALGVSSAPGAPPTRHLGFLGFDASALDREDVVTAQLTSINVGLAGSIAAAEDAAVTLTPLITSSPEAGDITVDKLRFMQDPASLRDDFVPGMGSYVIAARVSGEVQSAFPDRGDDEGSRHLSQSSGPIQVVVVADTDLLTDRLWVRVQNFLGQRLGSAFANNGDFVVNTLDNLTGSIDLISIRGRATFQRPFTRVEALKRESDEQFRATEEQLQMELDATEQKLTDLQASRNDDNTMIMTPAQSAEIERFLDRKLEIRKQLRQVRRDLDRDIENLGTWLKIINITLVPLLIVGFVLIRWLVRRQRSASV